MFDDKQQIMERVKSLPQGTPSPSRRYWCVTCKMLFTLDRPVCPYMPRMCINTPIPVELMPVESSICPVIVLAITLAAIAPPAATLPAPATPKASVLMVDWS